MDEIKRDYLCTCTVEMPILIGPTCLAKYDACLSISWSSLGARCSGYLLLCCEKNMYREILCKKKPKKTWIHTPVFTLSNRYTCTVLTHKNTHTSTHCVLNPQSKSTHNFIFFPKDSLFLTFYRLYLLGGWALRLGLILSYRLEPVPRGQLSANMQQPLSTYSDYSYTFCYTIPTCMSTQQVPTISIQTALNNTSQMGILRYSFMLEWNTTHSQSAKPEEQFDW